MTWVLLFILLAHPRTYRPLELVVKGQFFASRNVTHGVNIRSVIEHVGLAIGFAAMIDEPRLVAPDGPIDQNTVVKSKRIYTCRLSLADLHQKLRDRHPRADILDDARPPRYLPLSKHPRPLDPRAADTDEVTVLGFCHSHAMTSTEVRKINPTRRDYLIFVKEITS